MHGIHLSVLGVLRATSSALVVSGYLSRSYVCAIACAHSSTVLSAQGVLVYFKDFFYLIFPLNSWFSVTGAWAGRGGLGSWWGCG